MIHADAACQTDKIPFLAKYERASEFALQAIASVSAKQENYYKKKPKSLNTSADKASAAPQHRAKPATSGRASSRETPATDYAYHHNSNRNSNSRSFSSAGQPYQQYQDGAAATDPGLFNHAHQQQQQQLPGQHDYQEQQHQPQDPVEFERLERQALRRRRVEALESLAHTAALFLAEYMTANKTRQQAPVPSTPWEVAAAAGPGGESEGRRRHDHGVDYAAAAAGMTAQMMMSLDDSGSDSDGDESDAGTISNGGGPGHHEEDGNEGVLLKKDVRVGTAEEEGDDDDVDMESASAGSGPGDNEEGDLVTEEQEQEGGDDGDANDDDDGARAEMEQLASEVKIEED